MHSLKPTGNLTCFQTTNFHQIHMPLHNTWLQTDKCNTHACSERKLSQRHFVCRVHRLSETNVTSVIVVGHQQHRTRQSYVRKQAGEK
jgi:hypothetical protein